MARSRRSKLRRSLFKSERYYQSPTPLGEQSREQRREQRGQRTSLRRKMVMALLGVLLLLSIYFFGFIRQVQVKGLDAASSKHIESLADRYLDRAWYSRLKPFSGINGLAASIELNDSRFSGTKADLGLLSDTLVLSSTLRQPVASWRTDGDDERYLVDETGVVYKDPDVEASGLPAIVDTAGLKVDLGRQLVSLSTLEFILLMDQQLKAENFVDGQSTYLLSDLVKEVDLKAKGLPYIIKLSTERGAVDQARELMAALVHLSRQNHTPTSYIDLRVDDTAYYR